MLKRKKKLFEVKTKEIENSIENVIKTKLEMSFQMMKFFLSKFIIWNFKYEKFTPQKGKNKTKPPPKTPQQKQLLSDIPFKVFH